ncbi:hypothetical protein V6N13_136606 [Hibiscus sabdariffa]|uniref:Uncharacterized protein n=1 Tax=Hibiscus sabdariffa TaxID=183260 RepID=A0ABR2DN38_9ROSI
MSRGKDRQVLEPLIRVNLEWKEGGMFEEDDESAGRKAVVLLGFNGVAIYIQTNDFALTDVAEADLL